MNTVSIISFILATASVAVLTYTIVIRMKRSDDPTEEYFTGGRALTWPVVAGSLLLTNLSTEQLVGLNGAVFGDKALVGVAWEALAAFAMIATALLFLPTYMASGFTTTPAFLEKRFDLQSLCLHEQRTEIWFLRNHRCRSGPLCDCDPSLHIPQSRHYPLDLPDRFPLKAVEDGL